MNNTPYIYYYDRKTGITRYFRNFKLGQFYLTNQETIVKFIKVTNKGFNLLDIKTNKCILKHHLYSRDWSYKEIPNDTQIFKNVSIYDWLTLKEIDETTIKV